MIIQTPTEEHTELILEPQETDITSREKENECPDIDIVKEKDGLDTKSENSVSNNILTKMMISHIIMTLDLIQWISTDHVAYLPPIRSQSRA